MKISIIILSTALISGCATNQGFFKGENLIQPMPLPEESWVAYEKQDGHVYQRMWSKNDHNDQLKADIYRETPNRSVDKEKEIDDKVGKKKCDSFTSDDSRVVIENSYESLTWLSSCQIGDKEIAVLHKAVSGTDSFYHLRRIWKSGLDDKILSVWEQYFSTVLVCDTRASGDNHCPEGYTKVR